jgi:hypothetical protein
VWLYLRFSQRRLAPQAQALVERHLERQGSAR